MGDLLPSYVHGPETIPGDFGTFRFIAPDTIECGGETFNLEDPERVNTLLHLDGGNVDCLLDVWLLQLPPRWCMRAAKKIYSIRTAAHLAYAKGCDLDGNLIDRSSPDAEMRWLLSLEEAGDE